jgi:putative colanic acid biosynthesis UDP-glucose lipid carrier transferase
MNKKNRFRVMNFLAFEFILLNVVFVAFLFFRLTEFSFSDETFIARIGILGLIYNFSWLFNILYVRNNEFYFNPDHGIFKSILISLFFFVGLMITIVSFLKLKYFNFSDLVIPSIIFSLLSLLIHKVLLNYLGKRSSRLLSSTLLIGSGLNNSKLKDFSSAMTQHGYNVIGYLENRVEKPKNVLNLNILCDINELSDVLKTNTIEEIFIDMAEIDNTKISEIIKIADNFGIRVKLIPENPMLMTSKYSSFKIQNLVVFRLRHTPLDNFNKVILKRLFDFCLSLTIIILFSPLFLLISIFIYIESGGPILYSPIRKGEGGKPFKCYKFRTMSVSDNPLNGTKSTIQDDPRITKIGKILRKTDLDEMPQFFNVLIGNMSVIGPRPHRIQLQNDFTQSVSNYMVRSYIKPGITGWAQVNGWRGPTITKEQKNERIKHDLWYLENWSFWLDLRIVFMTIFGKHHLKAF